MTKTALISGATAGIGKATAILLVEYGINLIIPVTTPSDDM